MREDYHGWDYELEHQHFEELVAASRKNAVRGGKPWYRDWSDVGSNVYQVAELVQKEFPDITAGGMPEYDFSRYMQNASSACAALNGGSRAIMAAQIFLKRKGKKKDLSTLRYHAPEWIYACYHALIAKDYGYGGCTLSGVMRCLNEYGSVTSRPEISDRELVNLRWNTKAVFPGVFNQYSAEAEECQIVTTVPESFDDLRAALRAGFAVPYSLFGSNYTAALKALMSNLDEVENRIGELRKGDRIKLFDEKVVEFLNSVGGKMDKFTATASNLQIDLGSTLMPLLAELLPLLREVLLPLIELLKQHGPAVGEGLASLVKMLTGAGGAKRSADSIEGIQGFFHRLMGNDPAQLRGKDLSTPELTPEQKARLGKWQGAYGMKTSMNENKGIESLLADIKDELHGKLFTAYAS